MQYTNKTDRTPIKYQAWEAYHINYSLIPNYIKNTKSKYCLNYVTRWINKINKIKHHLSLSLSLRTKRNLFHVSPLKSIRTSANFGIHTLVFRDPTRIKSHDRHDRHLQTVLARWAFGRVPWSRRRLCGWPWVCRYRWWPGGRGAPWRRWRKRLVACGPSTRHRTEDPWSWPWNKQSGQRKLKEGIGGSRVLPSK